MTIARHEPASPRFVRHPKRPEWGVGRLIDVFQGRQRVRFADGETREFREDVLERVDGSSAPSELIALQDTVAPAPVRTAHDRARKARAAKAGAAEKPAKPKPE